MNGTIKFLPLVAALAMAACSSGGSSNMPGGTGLSAPQAHNVPDWIAKHQAREACPDVPRGQIQCLALIESGRLQPNVAGWAPTDFQTRYNLPSSTKGAGQVVAIVDAYDNPNVASDLAAYRTEFNLGTPTFNKYNQEGQMSGYPTGSPGWGVEIDLDVEMVSAVCPKCTIDLIETNSSNSSDLEAGNVEAVKLGAHIVSNSWICYDSISCVDGNDFNTKGVTYLAASGDKGYNQNGDPESLASVISVGGTTLSKSGSTYTEQVWNGAGGGCATGVAKPSWQHDPDCTSRTTSDVSAVAFDVAEYDTYSNPGWFTIGGTSVASPMTAGIIALAGNASKLDAGKGFWSLKKKKRNHDLHYISMGGDGSCGGEYLCTAGTNQFGTYSGPAGWGTANGVKAY